MTVSFSRSEVVFSTDWQRLAGVPDMRETHRAVNRAEEEIAFGPRPAPVAAKEVIPPSHSLRVPPRSQREWHDVFRGDR